MNTNWLKNKNIFVFGLGKSGESALKFLSENDARVYAWSDDKKQIERLETFYPKINFVHFNFSAATNIILLIFVSYSIKSISSGKEHLSPMTVILASAKNLFQADKEAFKTSSSPFLCTTTTFILRSRR